MPLNDYLFDMQIPFPGHRGTERLLALEIHEVGTIELANIPFSFSNLEYVLKRRFIAYPIVFYILFIAVGEIAAETFGAPDLTLSSRE